MGQIITEWRKQQVLAEVAGRVAAHMDAACEFVEEQARGLVAVESGLTRDDITHEVSAHGLTVEGRVGVLTGSDHAWYAHFVELGTSKMAARPFLRPAVFNNGAKIVSILEGGR